MLGVSVIIPMFNREKYISSAIDSVLSQDFEGLVEVIVVDDGSTDRSVEIARSYGEKIILVEKPESCKIQGPSGARNRGLAIATHEYVSFLDSDDYYLPGFLEKMIAELQANQEVGFVFCRLKRVDSDGVFSDWTRTRMSRLDVEYPFLFRSYGINTDTIVLRKKVLGEVGVFREDLTNGEDGDLWMRISERYPGKFVDYEGAVYRHGYGSQLTKKDTVYINECAKKVFLSALNRNFFKENRDYLRLLLIYRILLGIDRLEKGKKFFIYEAVDYFKLIVWYPLAFLKMIRMYMVRS
ncbi:MAG: glycosyltransferase [Desulfuromonadales bacterium]|nr:glycosyltransferase [Desulfuromonadales bacterium]